MLQEVYQSEIDDGLADKLKETSLAYLSEAAIISPDDPKIDTYKPILANSESKQIDLMYLEDTLASTGWNNNDDIFLPEETYKAKDTPVNKQFNLMHEQDKILGHITASIAVDLEGNVIENNLPQEKIPKHFDVRSGSVIYTKYRDETLQNKTDTLVAEIKNNEWCVSMECLFRQFDYGIMTAAGEQRIIERNKDTAYLTKYLRAYGGTGYINGNKIGRVLRNFVFSGKGLVKNPANKRSVILSTVGNTQFEPTETVQKMENVEMTIDQKMFDDLKAELAAAKAEALTYKSKTDESMVNGFKSEIENLKSQNSALASELDSYKKLSTEKDTTIVDLKKSIEEVNTALASSKQELADIQTSIAKSVRIAKLVKAGLEEAKAEEVFNKFATASDEAFNEVVNYQTLIVAKPKETLTEPVTETEVETDLEKAKADETAPLNIPNKEDKSKQLHEKFAAWFSNK